MKISKYEQWLILGSLLYVIYFGSILIICFPGKVIEIVAAMIGLLSVVSTGYGAYLGAKIAGDNATKLMKEQVIMSDLNAKTNKNLEFLNEFQVFTKNPLLNVNPSDNFLGKKLMSYEFFMRENVNLNSRLIELNSKDYDVSSIIKFPFESWLKISNTIYNQISRIDKMIPIILSNYILQKEKINKELYIIETAELSLSNLTLAMEENKVLEFRYHILYKPKKPFDLKRYYNRDCIINIDSKDLYNHYENELYNVIKEYLKLLVIFLKHYEKMKFKEPTDLIKYSSEYYSL
ncbi:hypothetical protein [Macrococcus bovicus]|uniref:Uncharacterized protein n=1 Tax=Macrococcus bovicus TaxID=69968 RepID=A0A4R6C3S7_9STAP|nr:hypothetical protein [Macrococcus bovicus]TDM15686.1 hypothetical protein ERX55_01910 [Macrococcus bovicus]